VNAVECGFKGVRRGASAMTSDSPVLFSLGTQPLDIVDQAKAVVELEAHALQRLAQLIDIRFADAVSLVLSIRGRVIVTGIGKSGHVGRKIASTLASTGTPAFFVHAGEAAHGDLGMITAADALLVLSNSGATVELMPVVGHAKALSIPIIAVSARGNAGLARDANISLLLPAVNEACASTLAPTTSTTMMMALGDALAVTVMRARGVTREAFRTLHPGGALGSRFSTVAAVMHGASRMPLVPLDAPMRETIIIMTQRRLGIAGVVDENGVLVGVITDGDLRRHIDELFVSTAGDVMTLDPVTVSATSLVEDALTLMNERKITALFVTSDGEPPRPVGIVHIHDFLGLGSA
jgi:arabinose-5-phosphate isomerase